MATDKAFELKEKLRELVKAIVEGDDYTEDASNEAITTLSALKNLKSQGKAPLSHHHDNKFFYHAPVPSHFLCPISGKLMEDPVSLANAKTYDRKSIEMWLNEVQETCPQTQQVLSHSILNPKPLVKDLISVWVKKHEFQPLPKPSAEEKVSLTEEQRNHLNSLLHSLTLSVSHQKEAAKEIRQLTKEMPAFRTLFKKPDVIQKLLSPLSPGTANVDLQLHEDLITTVFNTSIPGDNKRVFVQHGRLIFLLIDSIRSGTMRARSNAAAAISSLAEVDRNRRIIGRKPEVIEYLVKLLEEGDQSAIKDCTSAIHKLCFAHENKMRIVREGAVQIILHKIKDHVLVDELLKTLALLSTHHKAVEALHDHGAVPFLLGMIRETGASERSKEYCAAILYTVCRENRAIRKEIGEDEIVTGSLKELAECGNSRAKKKAHCILDKLQNDLLKHI